LNALRRKGIISTARFFESMVFVGILAALNDDQRTGLIVALVYFAAFQTLDKVMSHVLSIVLKDEPESLASSQHPVEKQLRTNGE
jgi:hypothetical protein